MLWNGTQVWEQCRSSTRPSNRPTDRPSYLSPARLFSRVLRLTNIHCFADRRLIGSWAMKLLEASSWRFILSKSSGRRNDRPVDGLADRLFDQARKIRWLSKMCSVVPQLVRVVAYPEFSSSVVSVTRLLVSTNHFGFITITSAIFPISDKTDHWAHDSQSPIEKRARCIEETFDYRTENKRKAANSRCCGL